VGDVRPGALQLGFRGEIWEWRGPAPYYFVTVPEAESELLAEVSPEVTYGWGMIPATVTIGASRWDTALWPKDGGYVVPVKTWVRRAEDLDAGVVVDLALVVPPG
jgi:hypothetical protein